MKTTHTPGPWTVNARRNVIGKVNGRDEVIALVADMPCIGGSDDLAAQRGCEMEHANARLIAAAPDTAAERDRLLAVNADLLATLETVNEVFGLGCNEREMIRNGLNQSELDAVLKTRAALARAKG